MCICLLSTDWTDFSANITTFPTILNFLPNETSKTIFVWSLHDEITEGTECFFFTLEPVNNLVNVPNDNRTVTICIEDDDS